jgi:hypothetical protein
VVVHSALQHFLLLLFAVGFSAIGWLMAHHPDRAYRFFTFGIQQENKFFIGFCRVVGWFFFVSFSLGTVMYVVLIIRDLLGLS